MKIIRRIGVLVILIGCFFILERDDIGYAQTSCPARDQCRDGAYADYTQQIDAANEIYMSQVQEATAERDSCLDPAEQRNLECKQQADYDFELNLARCQAIPDYDAARWCMDDLETIRQNAYGVCDYDLQNESEGCWQNIYYPLTQQAQADFFDRANTAQYFLDLAYSGCDVIC